MAAVVTVLPDGTDGLLLLELDMTQGWLEENLLKRRKKNRLTSPLKSLIRDTSP